MSGLPVPPWADLPRWAGGAAGPAAWCVLAPNPGPMTLEGTNTWLLAAPGSAQALVVDPGPDDEEHLTAVLATARERELRITSVLLTHGHADHSAGARRFAELAGTGVRALDPAHTLGGEGLVAGDVVHAGPLRVQVVPAPGHTADSLSFLLPEHGAVLTGDTVLGRGTTVVAHPDGRLADYLATLRRLRALAAEHPLDRVLPGHGPALALPDVAPVDVLEYYLRHRYERLDQVRGAIADGVRDPDAVVEYVYADVPRELRPAARLSVQAQLEYLGVS